MKKPVKLWFIIIIVIFTTGCASVIDAEQPAVVDSRKLDSSVSFGQTFTAQFAGLDAIEIYLAPLDAGDGRIQLQLRDNVQDPGNLAVTSLPLEDISTSGFYRFDLPVQKDSNQQDYYLLLKIKGTGSVEVGTARGRSYLEGAFHLNNQPKDNHQVAFKLGYYLPRLALGLGGEVLAWGWYLLVGIFLFVIPGWALIDLLWSQFAKDNSDGTSILVQALQNPLTKFVASLGISLGIYPILFVWTDLVGLHLGALYAWLPPVIGLSYLIYHLTRRLKNRTLEFKLPSIQMVDVVTILILLLVIAVRFWVIRSLALPLWGDSYHHTVITQLLIDNRGLFSSWQPYSASDTFTYHFGFHAISAVFHWVTQIPAAQATMIVGQLMNIAAIIVLYPLVMLIFKNKWGGATALLVAGLLSPMPMFYVNWGRYTQLAGHVFLLIGVWITWMIYKTKKSSWSLLIPAWVIICGLAFTHYRVMIFYLVFIITYLALNSRKDTFIPHIKKTAWIGVGAGILFLPWFINVFGGRILRLFQIVITNVPSAGSGGTSVISNTVGNLTTYLPLYVWVLVFLTLVICLLRKNLAVFTVSVWWILLFLLANPHWFGLPGKGIVDNFAVSIAFYMPAAVIIAAIPGWFTSREYQDQREFKFINITLAVLILGFGLFGTEQRRREANPLKYAIASSPDVRAAEWIKENTPQDAKFLVNAFFAFYDSVIVGSDGGWWLPIIADRQTTLPPITYNFESEPFPDYHQWVQGPTRMIEAHGITHPETLAALVEYGVTHVYIGQQQGSVNYNGPLRLSAADLQSDPHFTPVYHQDRVWIFEFEP